MTCISEKGLLAAPILSVVEVSHLRHPHKLALLASASLTLLNQPVMAQPADTDTVQAAQADSANEIVVTAARSILPANALPLTVDVIGKDDLDQQVSISGSVTDAVATLTPILLSHPAKAFGCG